MARIFTFLSPLAGLLAFVGAFIGGCTPSPYYTDPDYTEYNRPRTVIVREPNQPPRAVLIRDKRPEDAEKATGVPPSRE